MLEIWSKYQQEIFILVAVGLFIAGRWLKFRRARARLPGLLRDGALLVDVRSPGEFAVGHHPESINVPLAELGGVAKDWSKNRTVILCCASGTRSGMAAGVLKGLGFTSVLNAGPWTNTLA